VALVNRATPWASAGGHNRQQLLVFDAGKPAGRIKQPIISSLHVHFDHDNCLEVLVLRGRASVVRSVAEHLIAVRRVKHGELMLTTAGKDLPV
jgi:hypothetical protein